MSIPLPKLIVILGPTASGKTDLAVKLAREFDGEIVSADSRQIYREMDIGTNKTISSQQLVARQHMIDVASPNEEFALAQYKEKALKMIKDIHNRGKIPFLVGGTGLYIQAIVDNLQIPKVAPNKALRERLEKLKLAKLLEMLKKVDSQAAEVIDSSNKRRLIRALEVSLGTGKAFSSVQSKGKPFFDCLQIGIKIPREELYKKINKRVDEMIEEGLADEVKKLKEKYSCALPSMSGIGYKELCNFFKGKNDLNEAIRLIKRNTRRYARRQMTWFRRDKRIRWIEKREQTKNLIREFLKKD